jgi:FKBP-type peptidyl-prolyl cis-trans isomerase
MKLTRLLPAAALLLGASAALPAADSIPAAATPAAEARKFTEPELLEMLGWVVGRQTGLGQFEFNETETASIAKGFALAAAAKDSPFKPDEISSQFQAYMGGREKGVLAKQIAELEKKAAAGDAEAKALVEQMKAQQTAMAVQEKAQQAATAATDSAVAAQRQGMQAAEAAATAAGKQSASASEKFTAYKTPQPGVTTLPSGLLYEILKPGSGPMPKATDTVRVNYTGLLLDGTVFDATLKHPPFDPAEFPLDQVIAGWTEGIQKINKGGVIRLIIPAKLAYGDKSPPGIPPGSMLVFEVELLDINPKAK